MSSCGGLLGLCAISVSFSGISMAKGGGVLSFPVFTGAIVLLPWRDFSGVVGVVFFSVDSLGGVQFGEKGDSWGCRGGSLFFDTSVSLCVISTISVR